MTAEGDAAQALVDVTWLADGVHDDGTGRIDFAHKRGALVGDEFAVFHRSAIAFSGTGKTAIKRDRS